VKALFLDVDGVLNSEAWFVKQRRLKGRVDACEVDPEPVMRILNIVEATGAKIVLSSSWRNQPDLVEYLRSTGLPIHDMTPEVNAGFERHMDIIAWLDDNEDVKRFAIVDDDIDAGDHQRLRSSFVKTDARYGLRGEHARKLIDILGVKGD